MGSLSSVQPAAAPPAPWLDPLSPDRILPLPLLHVLDQNATDCIEYLRTLWTPPVVLPLADWAEQNIVLSSEYAALSTNLRLYHWQREIFNTFTDPSVEETVLMVGTQLVKTLMIQCAIAYVVKEDPGPILLVEPKEDDAKAFSKERLSPMLRDCACLKGRLSESIRDGNTLLFKEFSGGSLSLVGAIAPGNLARRSIRYLFADEIDKYPASAGNEGDPLKIAYQRMATFGTRKKSILTCSPTMAGFSRIGKAYAVSDQRKYHVPCHSHSCGQFQVLKWSQVRWDAALSLEKQPDSAFYECFHCRAPWTDLQRKNSCQKGRWIADKPFAGRAGFWISRLYSPWEDLSSHVRQFIESEGDDRQRKVFVNTVLAELWEEKGLLPDFKRLFNRREEYSFGNHAIIPQRGLFLTAFVDVQDNPARLEVEVRAWGRYRESWSIGYWIIQAWSNEDVPQLLPVSSPELWAKLDQLVLQRNWQHESGNMLPIMAMGIDTGNRPKPVYEFALSHAQCVFNPARGLDIVAPRTVVPTKGNDDSLKILSNVSKESAASKRQGVRILLVGTHCAKQEIYDDLREVWSKPDGSLGGAPVPRCFHFPAYELPYFEGLTAEVRLTKEDGKIVWEKRGPRNEPLDLAVGNRAMAALYGMDRNMYKDAWWAPLEAMVRPLAVSDETAVSPVVPVGSTPPQPSFEPAAPAYPPVQNPTTRPVRAIRGRFIP